MICSKDFYNKNKYNSETNEQLWMSIVGDAHELTCSCDKPFAHMLASIFPLGHKDRDLTINQILQRDLKEKWLSSGAADASYGGANKEGHTTKENTGEENVGRDEDADFAALLAAVEENQER